MKKILITIIVLSINVYALKAQLRSEVNECFELTSIAFRLAGAEEYSYNGVPDYLHNVDEYFAEHKNHKLITFIQSLRSGNAVAYDAVPTAAARIKIVDGKVTVTDEFDPAKISDLDERWSKKSFIKFVELLDDFYAETNFRKFYDNHTELYGEAVRHMDKQLKEIKTEWFVNFFVKELGNPWIVVSLCNYPCNYGLVDLPYDDCSRGIVIGCRVDKEGMLAFSEFVQSTIVHEFCHSFSNPIFELIWDQLEPFANTIYPSIEEDMMKIAYGNPRTSLLEWQNRLFTLMYFKENNQNETVLKYKISADQNLGFIWMNRSVKFMDNFLNNRDTFVTIDDFLPQLINFIHYTADNFDRVKFEFNNRRPYITETFPVANSKLSDGIDKITIRFSEPMNHSMGSIHIENDQIQHLECAKMPYWQDEYIFVYPINNNKLDRNKTYGFKLSRGFFQSTEMYSMQADYEYTIKTTKQ